MDNILSEIENKLDYEQKLTEYVEELRQRSNKEQLNKFSEFRNFPLSVVEACDVFYVGEMAEMLTPRFIEYVEKFGVVSPTNRRPIFSNRYVIPIKNEHGLVQNLVGYSADADERYIYGTAKYYRRKEVLWGLENLHLAYDMGYAILLEGITDAIRMRCMGYPNAFAMCGTHESEYIMKQLNRCRHGIIRIPDRDDAGIRALKGWACNRHITININFAYKDVDEMCKESSENQQWFKDYMQDCINWLVGDTHNGQKCICESVTIL